MDAAHLFERASGRLPSVPKVVQELISSFQDTAVSIDSIIDKVAQDQVLSARVLRLANTARFGGLGRVGSLDEAVVLLGFDNLRMLVIASGITDAAVRMPHFDMPAFWQHSLGRANAAKGLARLAGLDPSWAIPAAFWHRSGNWCCMPRCRWRPAMWTVWWPGAATV